MEENSVLIAVQRPGAFEIRWDGKSFFCVGSQEFLDKAQFWTQSLESRDAQNWSSPLDFLSVEKPSAVDWTLWEFWKKCRGEWELPYQHEEVCHCRNVSLDRILETIIWGANNVETIVRLTKATTGCGTCLAHVSVLLDFFLKSINQGTQIRRQDPPQGPTPA